MQTTLAAEARSGAPGKGTARKIRKNGKVPAVVYAGGDAPLQIEVNPLALLEVFRLTQNRNTVVQVQLDDQLISCLVQDVQRHPLSRDVLHVDFYRLSDGQVVEVMVPVRGVGKAKGMAIGGRLRLMRREVMVRCQWTAIPETVDHDIRPMEINDIVRASELILPDGVELIFENDFNVMTIYGRQAEPEPEAVVEAAVAVAPVVEGA